VHAAQGSKVEQEVKWRIGQQVLEHISKEDDGEKVVKLEAVSCKHPRSVTKPMSAHVSSKHPRYVDVTLCMMM